MKLKSYLDQLKTNGFVNLGKILSNEDIVIISKITEEILSSIDLNHPDYLPPTTGVKGVMRIPQHHKTIADILDKLFSDSDFRLFLEDLVGPCFKVWQINLRRSSPGDPGLFLHQDGPGETGICIMLTDNQKGIGSTTFLKGSHILPKRFKDMGIELPPIVSRFLGVLLSRLKGQRGDVAVFFNRTLHGRSHNDSAENHDVILISLFPAGQTLSYEGYGQWDKAFLTSIKGSTLSALVDPNLGTSAIKDDTFLINGDSSAAYSNSIDCCITEPSVSSSLKLKVALFKFISLTGRPFVRLLRKLK